MDPSLNYYKIEPEMISCSSLIPQLQPPSGTFTAIPTREQHKHLPCSIIRVVTQSATLVPLVEGNAAVLSLPSHRLRHRCAAVHNPACGTRDICHSQCGQSLADFQSGYPKLRYASFCFLADVWSSFSLPYTLLLSSQIRYGTLPLYLSFLFFSLLRQCSKLHLVFVGKQKHKPAALT